MKKTPGMQWMREEFTRSPWTKKQLIALIESQDIPGEVIAGEPFVYAARVATWKKPVDTDSIPNFFAEA